MKGPTKLGELFPLGTRERVIWHYRKRQVAKDKDSVYFDIFARAEYLGQIRMSGNGWSHSLDPIRIYKRELSAVKALARKRGKLHEIKRG